MPDINDHPLSFEGSGWSLETSDGCTVFLKYRDIDVVSIWTPYDDPEAETWIAVPSVGQLEDMLRDAEDERHPYVEWSHADEITISLRDQCEAIDKLRAAIDGFNAEEEQFPVEDWRYEVANGDTQRGYRDWVRIKARRH